MLICDKCYDDYFLEDFLDLQNEDIITWEEPYRNKWENISKLCDIVYATNTMNVLEKFLLKLVTKLF